MAAAAEGAGSRAPRWPLIAAHIAARGAQDDAGGGGEELRAGEVETCRYGELNWLVSALEAANLPPETKFWVDIAVVNQHVNNAASANYAVGARRIATRSPTAQRRSAPPLGVPGADVGIAQSPRKPRRMRAEVEQSRGRSSRNE